MLDTFITFGQSQASYLGLFPIFMHHRHDNGVNPLIQVSASQIYTAALFKEELHPLPQWMMRSHVVAVTLLKLHKPRVAPQNEAFCGP